MYCKWFSFLLTLSTSFWEINAFFNVSMIYSFDSFNMRNKCIRNDIKLCVFLSALHFKMSLSKAKHQHTDRTLEILGKLDCGVKAVDLCKQFNLSQSTLSTWKKQRCKLNEMVDAGKVLNTKHNRESFLLQVERALHLWFCEMRSKPHASPINQALLVQKST